MGERKIAVQCVATRKFDLARRIKLLIEMTSEPTGFIRDDGPDRAVQRKTDWLSDRE